MKLRQNGIVSFPIRLAVFQARGGARMKHLFRQDLQDYQDFFYLVRLYPVHPVDPVRKIKLYFVKFFIRLNWPLWQPAARLNTET
jgi:hypothetical protein